MVSENIEKLRFGRNFRDKRFFKKMQSVPDADGLFVSVENDEIILTLLVDSKPLCKVSYEWVDSAVQNFIADAKAEFEASKT